jgi:hypothetical protein
MVFGFSWFLVYLQLILCLFSLGPLRIDSFHLLHQLDLMRFGVKIGDQALGFERFRVSPFINSTGCWVDPSMQAFICTLV